MKVLIIKMSSLGDILHTFPALTDAGDNMPSIRFDWVVEESFSELPTWHPLVNKVIPLAFRRLRKTPIKSLFSKEWNVFFRALRAEKYDVIIDAQGLVKSGLITFLARGCKAGLDKHSSWEPFARFAYQKKYAVNPEQHAVDRVRQLFAQALGYALPTTPADYGLNREQFSTTSAESYLLFFHGTTWATKLWPEAYWIELGKLASARGLTIYLPFGNDEEKKRAEKIASAVPSADVLPKLNLTEMATKIVNAKAVISVDTGLGHLAAALSAPTISLYGPTDPLKTGTIGNNQQHLTAKFPCSPCLRRECTYTQPSTEKPACFTTLPPNRVWAALQKFL